MPVQPPARVTAAAIQQTNGVIADVKPGARAAAGGPPRRAIALNS